MDDASVEKIMSLDLGEFHRSLRVLAPGLSAAPDQTRFVVSEGDFSVTLTFESLPSSTLGGLLSLPRARVHLAFDGAPERDRVAFLGRFDRAFQRGGG